MLYLCDDDARSGMIQFTRFEEKAREREGGKTLSMLMNYNTNNRGRV